jgi:hypothetical protein
MVGCVPGSRFITKVNSIATDALPKSKTYLIKNLNGGNEPFSLRENSRLEIIHRMLSDLGYIKSNSKNASYILEISYGISDPTTKTGSSPIFGQTGVSSSTTYGSVNSYGSFNATTYNTPSYGVVGSRSYSHTHYTRFLIVRGFSVKGEELFETRSVSTGSSNDIDQVLPVLIYNMYPYFGKNTSRTIESSTTLSDRRYRNWIQSINPSLGSVNPYRQNTITEPKVETLSPTNQSLQNPKNEARRKLIELYTRGEITREEYDQMIKKLD